MTRVRSDTALRGSHWISLLGYVGFRLPTAACEALLWTTTSMARTTEAVCSILRLTPSRDRPGMLSACLRKGQECQPGTTRKRFRNGACRQLRGERGRKWQDLEDGSDD